MSVSASARDFMTRDVVTFSPHMDVMDAIHELVETGFSGAPVVDASGNLIGIMTERDCLDAALKASYHGEPGGPVAEFMSRDLEWVAGDASLLDVANLFVNTKYRRYPVVEGGRLVGLISRHDVLRALLRLH